MSDEDRNAAMELAIEELSAKFDWTLRKLKDKWGNGEKQTNREQHALIFARKLALVGGTFEFTPAHRDFGYETIWQAMAGELDDPTAKPMQKAEIAREKASMYQSGCIEFSDKLALEWDDQVVYRVPRTVNGGRIEWITINGAQVVNKANETAYSVWRAREVGRVEGQVKATVVKLARSTTTEYAANMLTTTLATTIQKLPTLVKRGTREDEFARGESA